MKEKRLTNILKNQKKFFKKQSQKILRKTRKIISRRTREKKFTKELKKAEEFFKKLEEEDFNKLKKHHYHDNDYPNYEGIRHRKFI